MNVYSKVRLELPPKLVPVFTGNHRYRGAYGGRGSAKTRSFAKMTAVKAYQLSEQGETGVILCAREFMNSLDESSMAEVKAAILSEPWLAAYFDVGEKYIRTKNGLIRYAFSGLRHNIDSIKSKAKILICWIDEAECVSEVAWNKTTKTVREKGSEIWVTWNPESPESATHKRFREDPPTNSAVVELNWQDNPWFPAELNQERLDDLSKRPETYDWTWEGSFLEITDAQIFKNKFAVRDFEVDESFGEPLQGMDFGFSRDPTTAVRCYIKDDYIYIRDDCGKVGLELDDTTNFIMTRIVKFDDHPSRADSARPESISYLQRHGLPMIKGVKKWQGSVEDGIEFMKSFAGIIIHPSCVATAKEFRSYVHKVDDRTGEILKTIVDDNNHYIDAIRYALTPLMKPKAEPRLRSLG